MSQPFQQAPYLRSQRQFPNDDLKPLANQMDHAYIDIALKVNDRSIGLYANNTEIVSGEKWFTQGQPKPLQSLRRLFNFTAVGPITHGIIWNGLNSVTKPFGSVTDGTNWYGVIYGSSVAIPGNYSFYVTPTQIIVLAGGGAPAITSGFISLEWLSNF